MLRYIVDWAIRRQLINLPNPSNLEGAPATIKKYRNSFLEEGVFSNKEIFWGADNRQPSSPVTFDCEEIKPSRAFLMMINHKGPVKGQDDHLEKVVGLSKIQYPIEVVAPLSGVEVENFCIQQGLSWNVSDENARSIAHIIRFISHFKVWQYCIQQRESVLAMEWGAPMLTSMPQLQLKHITILSRLAGDDSEPLPQQRSEFYDLPIPSCCYAVSPAGASKLVGGVRQMMQPNFDAFMLRMLGKMKVVYHPLLSQGGGRYQGALSAQKHGVRGASI